MNENTLVVKRERIVWVDQLKAVAMLLVFLGHVALSADVIKYIYSFHMPLFFIISGMMHRPGKYASFQAVFIDRFKRLMVPFFLLNLLMLPLWILNWKVIGDSNVEILTLFKGMLYINHDVYQTPTNATWFLAVLFLVELLVYACERLVKSNVYVLFCVFLFFSLLTYADSLQAENSGIWHVRTVPMAAFFFFCGYLFFQNKEKIFAFIHSKSRYGISILLLLLCGYYFSTRNGRISMHSDNYYSLIYFYIAAFATSAAVILLVMKLPKLKVFMYIGQNTLLYMGIHAPIMRFFENIYPPITTNHWLAFALAIGVYFAIIPIVFLINKFLPVISGKSYKKKPG